MSTTSEDSLFARRPTIGPTIGPTKVFVKKLISSDKCKETSTHTIFKLSAAIL